MKNFKFALIPIVLSSLAACTAQSPPTTKICSDHQGRRVTDDLCNRPQQQVAGGSGDFMPYPYYWYYMHPGFSGYYPPVGGFIDSSSGSITPRSGVAYSSGVISSGGVVRGGFGATGAAFSGAGS